MGSKGRNGMGTITQEEQKHKEKGKSLSWRWLSFSFQKEPRSFQILPSNLLSVAFPFMPQIMHVWRAGITSLIPVCLIVGISKYVFTGDVAWISLTPSEGTNLLTPWSQASHFQKHEINVWCWSYSVVVVCYDSPSNYVPPTHLSQCCLPQEAFFQVSFLPSHLWTLQAGGFIPSPLTTACTCVTVMHEPALSPW